jgi:hypothetical protein
MEDMVKKYLENVSKIRDEWFDETMYMLRLAPEEYMIEYQVESTDKIRYKIKNKTLGFYVGEEKIIEYHFCKIWNAQN